MPMTPAEVLKKHWGYDTFRPAQLEIIESVLSGRDTIGLLPTGGGKSITFQVPALMMPGLTIVVTPLISLMKDQVDNLRDRDIRACLLHSGMTMSETRLALDRCRLGKTPLLYLSPEKLQSESLLSEMRMWQVSMIVVDEAHCISQWGYDFRPSYMNIGKLRKIFADAPVLALTASATPQVVSDIALRLEMKEPQIFTRSFSRKNISYIVRNVDHKEQMLLRVLKNTTGTAIVYVRSRRRTRLIADLLSEQGISADYYHAGLDPADKADRQNRWKDGTTRVIVATNAFGMGIDKADVRTVVHYDLPTSLEEYYQEAGRAGRDGLPSFAVILANSTDKALLTKRLNEAFPPKEIVVRVYEMIGNFLDIAVGEGYLRVYEFNEALFCERFGFKPEVVRSALTILTQSEYLQYVEETSTRSRVMITADKREFYNLRLDPVTEAVFESLQRCYTGLFADYVYINEAWIQRNAQARRPDLSADQVYQSLLTLSQMHVINYIPRKTTPYIVYTTSREEPRYVAIPRHAYEERRQRMSDRIEAMKAFVFGKNQHCRVQTMLEYFGEKNTDNCGTCDICRDRKKQSKKPTQTTDIEAISYIVNQGEKTIDQIVAQSPLPRNATITTLQKMADKGLIETTYEGTVRPKNKR